MEATQPPVGRHHQIDFGYSLPFLLCFAMLLGVVYLFLREGWALVHVPDVNSLLNGSWLNLPLSGTPTAGATAIGH